MAILGWLTKFIDRRLARGECVRLAFATRRRKSRMRIGRLALLVADCIRAQIPKPEIATPFRGNSERSKTTGPVREQKGETNRDTSHLSNWDQLPGRSGKHKEGVFRKD